MKNLIGIDKEKSVELVEQLNILLADYHVYYQKLKAAHWGITGPGFFELHAKFEIMYTAAATFIDELAERILTLGGSPIQTMAEYLVKSRLKETSGKIVDKIAVQEAVQDLNQLIILERQILTLAQAAEDEGSATLMSDNIKLQEKETWMLSAYLK